VKGHETNHKLFTVTSTLKPVSKQNRGTSSAELTDCGREREKGFGYEVHLTSEKERAKSIREVQKMTQGNKICNITGKLLSNGIATIQAKQS